jgi:hypothetical protein
MDHAAWCRIDRKRRPLIYFSRQKYGREENVYSVTKGERRGNSFPGKNDFALFFINSENCIE